MAQPCWSQRSLRENREEKPQVPPLRYPGSSVEVGGVGELHAAFFTESRTRGRWCGQRSRKSGCAPAGMTKGRVVALIRSRRIGWREKLPATRRGQFFFSCLRIACNSWRRFAVVLG